MAGSNVTLAFQRGGKHSLFPGAARGPTGVIKSILDTSRTDGGRRDEIFVDIVEKVSCTFNSNGYIQNSQIDGAIQVCRHPLIVSEDTVWAIVKYAPGHSTS